MIDQNLKLKMFHQFLFNREFYVATRGYIKPEFFDSPVLKRSVQFVHNAFTKLGVVFTYDIYESVIRRDKALNVKYTEVIDFLLEELKEMVVPPAEMTFLVEMAKQEVRNQKAVEVLRDGTKHVEEGNIDQFVKDVVTKLSERELKQLMHLDFLTDFSAVVSMLNSRDESKIATLISALDHLLAGGFAPKELTVLMAGPGIGKTALLVNFAWAALLQKKTVAYYTLEVSAPVLFMRAFCLATGLTSEEVLENPQQAKAVFEKHPCRSFFGNLHIFEYPSHSISSFDLEQHLREMIQYRDIIPDLVLVDYGDLLIPTRSYRNRFEELDSIYVHLRGVAAKLGVHLITASQVNREGMKTDSADNVHVAGSYAKIATADVVLSLNQNEDEKIRKRMRLIVTKNRNAALGDPIELEVDFKRSLMREPVENMAYSGWQV